MQVDPEGQPSLTRWRVLARGDGVNAWLELRPVTGRTHQLRVHCAAMAGRSSATRSTEPSRFGGPGLHLHARAITVPLYPKKPAITVEAPVPPHMRSLLDRLGDASFDPP